MQFSSIKPRDRALSGAAIPGQSGRGSDGNEGVVCIPQSSSIARTSLSDCLVSYQGHSMVVVLPLYGGSVYSPSQLVINLTVCKQMIVFLVWFNGILNIVG